MLKLRRGTVVSVDPLEVEIEGERRRAWADVHLVGPVEAGDEVVVNVEALDLGLGSGGFDVVHVNLSRGLGGEGAVGEHVMKLNYTSLQHPVEPVEVADDGVEGAGPKPPVAVISLHGHLAPLAWAAQQSRPGLKVGFVQGAGAALPGGLSRDLVELRERGLICGHITAGAAHGGEHEAISVAGAIDAAARRLEWDAVVVGPGPGILGSATRLGHGGMAALEAAHAALALGMPTLVCARLSSSDERPRHRGLSHHTATVLEMLLAPVRVPVPEAEIEGWPLLGSDAPEGGSAQAALDDLIEICTGRHDLAVAEDRPRRLCGERPAGDDHGPVDHRRPSVLRRAACGRPRVGSRDRRVEDAGWSESIQRRSTRGRSSTSASIAFATTTARRPTARSRSIPGRSRSPRTTTTSSGSCASRARRWANRDSWSCRRASSTSRASRRSTAHKRELVEEIGRSAQDWTEVKRFYTSPGFAEEEVTVFFATGIEEVSDHEPDPEERIEIVAWPLAELDAAIEECIDSKTLIGLLLLRDSLR